jgi:hypothetical protein
MELCLLLSSGWIVMMKGSISFSIKCIIMVLDSLKIRSFAMKRINIDLKKLLGFKIVANQLSNINSLKIGAKLGGKPGVKPSPKSAAKNS